MTCAVTANVNFGSAEYPAEINVGSEKIELSDFRSAAQNAVDYESASFALDRIRGYVGFADGNSKHINSIGRFEVVNESVLPMTVLFVSNSRHSSEWGVPTTVAPMSRRLLFEGRPRDINAYLGEPGGHAMKYPVKGRLIFTFLEGPLPKEVKILDMIQGDVL